jgi:hypothetical protein
MSHYIAIHEADGIYVHGANDRNTPTMILSIFIVELVTH